MCVRVALRRLFACRGVLETLQASLSVLRVAQRRGDSVTQPPQALVVAPQLRLPRAGFVARPESCARFTDQGSWFGVWGLSVWCLGFRVWGLGLWVGGWGFGIWSLGCGVQGLGLGGFGGWSLEFEVCGLGFGVKSLKLRV